MDEKIKKVVSSIVCITIYILIGIGVWFLATMIYDMVAFSRALEQTRLLDGIPYDTYYNEPFMKTFISDGYWAIFEEKAIFIPLFISAVVVYISSKIIMKNNSKKKKREVETQQQQEIK